MNVYYAVLKEPGTATDAVSGEKRSAKKAARSGKEHDPCLSRQHLVCY